MKPAAQDSLFSRSFSGLARLYSDAGLGALSRARVMVVGIGGVGSWAAESLARSGVGHIILVDLDNIAPSNINRQIHALISTIGKPKVEAMRERILQINPMCEVVCIEDFVSPENWLSIVTQSEPDALLDCCDEFRAKECMAAWALKQPKTIFITVGAAGGKTHAEQVEIADLRDVTHDPILGKLRYQLRRHHGAPADKKIMRINCVFSKEPVHKPPTSECAIAGIGSLACHGYGSLVSVTATFGLCAAGWVQGILINI